MKKQNWKVGDWGIFEFELSMIKEMKGSEITSVSDGTICTGGLSLNDRFFPLDLKTKQLSDSVNYWRNKFHRDCKGLNYPDLHRKLVQVWVGLIEVKEDEKMLTKAIKELDDFGTEVCRKAQDLKYVDVGGVNIFR